MSEAFEKWFKTEMLPAECDDERVMVGMRLCWNAAMRYAAAVAETVRTDRGPNMSVDTACDIIKEIVLREEVKGE